MLKRLVSLLFPFVIGPGSVPSLKARQTWLAGPVSGGFLIFGGVALTLHAAGAHFSKLQDVPQLALHVEQVLLMNDHPEAGAGSGLMQSGSLATCSHVAHTNSGCSAVLITRWNPTSPRSICVPFTFASMV